MAVFVLCSQNLAEVWPHTYNQELIMADELKKLLLAFVNGLGNNTTLFLLSLWCGAGGLLLDCKPSCLSLIR